MGWYIFRFTRTNKDYTFIVVTCGYTSTETYDLIYHYHCLQNEPDKHLAKHVQVCYIYIEKKNQEIFLK